MFELNASMMCANFGNLEKEVKELDTAGIDSFHIDIMDGRYVGNFAMSLYDMEYIASATTTPLDVHLMIEHPNNNIQMFLNRLRKGDTVYIHPEAEYHPINPGTSIETVYEMLHIVDKVLVMTVNPGNAGQMYLPYVGEKVERLVSMKEEMGVKVYWDGACGKDKIEEFAPKGVDGFVLGTTVLFGKDRPYGDILREIREIG